MKKSSVMLKYFLLLVLAVTVNYTIVAPSPFENQSKNEMVEKVHKKNIEKILVSNLVSIR